MGKPGVLFICTHNSARSQMAEAWLRHLGGNHYSAYSAGVEPGVINPLTVQAMNEVGVDMRNAKAEGVQAYLGKVLVQTLVVVCDKAAASCPRAWPGVSERLHWFFNDPSRAIGTEEERLAEFRRVRDEIRAKVESWLREQGLDPALTPVKAGA